MKVQTLAEMHQKIVPLFPQPVRFLTDLVAPRGYSQDRKEAAGLSNRRPCHPDDGRSSDPYGS